MSKDLSEGDVVSGVVKNVTDFGAFIDLGNECIGLCTLADMSWGRISHPSDFVQVGEKINVKVLLVDEPQDRILLGIKQLSKDPWCDIQKRYHIGERLKGKVVNVLNFGVFVRLEEHIEGFVQLSQTCDATSANHPKEIATIGDEIEVEILDINLNRQEITLSI